MKYSVIRYIVAFLKIIFWLTLAVFIVGFVYVFYHEEFSFMGVDIINPYYHFVEDMSVWVYVVLYFIALTLIVSFIFISLSHYFNIYKSESLKVRERYFRFFTYVLTSYFMLDLFQKEPRRKRLFRNIKSHIRTRKQRLVLFEAYLKIQETITMDLSADFMLLINDLHLQKSIESLVFSKNFDDRILGVRMLSYLQIHTCDEQIVLYAKNDNVALRTEAYAALIRLMKKDEHLLYYIGEKYQLSTLDINIVVRAVLKNKKVNINYKRLLFSLNPQKIAIGLILIKYRYHRNEQNLFLIEDFLGNADPLINNLAWDALLAIVPDDDCVKLILERFESETEAAKLNILQKSHHVINDDFFSFLARIMEHQTLFVKLEAMIILFHNDFDLLEQFLASPNEEIRMAYEEATCMYLNE